MKTTFDISNDVLRQADAVVTVVAQPNNFFVLYTTKNRFVKTDDAPITIKGRPEFAVKLVELLFGEKKELPPETKDPNLDHTHQVTGQNPPMIFSGDFLIVDTVDYQVYVYDNPAVLQYWNQPGNAIKILEVYRSGKKIWERIPDFTF